MATNPYVNLPVDKNGAVMQEFPATASVKAIYASENASTSSVITVTKDTTIIEVAAVGGPAVVRFVKVTDGTGAATSVISAASGANFDHVIPTATYRRFALPIEGLYQAPSSMVGANTLNGLYQRVAIKSIGVASVLLTEY